MAPTGGTGFIAGGDQANYVRGWKGTAIERAINAGIAEGKAIGGTSAGLAVLGEFVYGALGDKPDDKDLASTDVLPRTIALFKTPGLRDPSRCASPAGDGFVCEGFEA